jgi:hypothetical protein
MISIMRVAVLAALAALLCSCSHGLGGSVAGSECKVFEPPRYAVRGRAPYDQDWIDSTIEGGVGACRWQRPAPRPPQLDAAPITRKAPAAPAAARKKGALQRARERLLSAWHRTHATPPAPVEAAPVEPAPEVPATVAVPAPAPAPRDPVDELLHPDGQ